MVGGAGTGERVKKKRLSLLEMLSALAWKTVVACGGKLSDVATFWVPGGWCALRLDAVEVGAHNLDGGVLVSG